MYVSKNELIEIRSQVIDDRVALEGYNKKGKRCVPDDNKIRHTALLYTEWMLTKIIQRMNKGKVEYKRDYIVHRLRTENWQAVSHSGKAFSGSVLKELFGGKDVMLRFAYQAVYLEKAGKYLADLIEVPISDVGSAVSDKK